MWRTLLLHALRENKVGLQGRGHKQEGIGRAESHTASPGAGHSVALEALEGAWRLG